MLYDSFNLVQIKRHYLFTARFRVRIQCFSIQKHGRGVNGPGELLMRLGKVLNELIVFA